jgi:hypothetical protein
VVEDLVHRRPHRAPGIEHIVDQQQRAAGDIERDPRRAHGRLQAARREVVAIEGDVEDADRRLDREFGPQPLGEPDAAGMDPDQADLVRVAAAQPGGNATGEGPVDRFGVEVDRGHRGVIRHRATARPPTRRATAAG